MSRCELGKSSPELNERLSPFDEVEASLQANHQASQRSGTVACHDIVRAELAASAKADEQVRQLLNPFYPS